MCFDNYTTTLEQLSYILNLLLYKYFIFNVFQVLCSGIPMELPKSDLSQVKRFSVSWKLWVSPLICQRTCTTWLRRPSPWGSTWNVTGRTRTANSDWFLSSPESTDWLVTTRQRVCSLPTGNMSRALPPL